MATQELDREKEIQADCLTYLAMRLELERTIAADPHLLERGVVPLAAMAIAEGIETEVIWDNGVHEVFNASQTEAVA